MGSKIKRFLDRFLRNSNDEIDGLRRDLEKDAAFLQSEDDKLHSELIENYRYYLEDNKKLRDELFAAAYSLKDEFDKHVIADNQKLKHFADIITNPGLRPDEQKKLLQ